MAKNTQNKEKHGTDGTQCPLSDKKEKFIKAFADSDCNVAECCRRIKIGRRTFYNWKKKDDEFAQSCEDIEEGLIDNAESKLQELINDKNQAAIFFFLKTKGKKRGYDETHQIEINKPYNKAFLEGV